MRIVFFALSVMVLATLGGGFARADGSAIRIVNPDGSVTNFVIPKDYRPGALPPLHGRIETEKKENAPPPAPVAADEKPIKEEQAKEAPVKEEAVKEAVVPVPASSPPQEKAAIDATPPAKPVADKKSPAIKESSVKLPPLPGRKPAMMAKAAAIAAPAVPYVAPPPESAQAAGVIGKNRAVAIALSHAPPASNYKVAGRMEGDRRVYAVTFRTEKGAHEVLVDAESGDILRR